MTLLNKTLIALMLSTSLFGACSKKDLTGGKPIPQKSDIVSEDGQAGRFVSYNTINNPELEGSKVLAKAVLAIPSAPAIPDGAVNMLDIDGKGTQYADWKVQKGTDYYLPEGAEWTGKIKFIEGVNYYIDGALTLDFYGTKSQLNILPNGSLNIANGQSLNALTVRCWGALEVDPKINLVIGLGTSFSCYSDSEITANMMQNQGTFEHYGNITLSSDLDCSGFKSTFTLHGSISANSMKVYNASEAYVGGNVVAKTGLEVSGQSSLIVGASVVVESGKVYTTNHSTLDVADYIKCTTLELDSYANILTHSETLVVCDSLIFQNNTSKIHNVDAEGAYTVVVTDNIVAQANIDRLNGGGIDLHTDPEEYENLGWTANVIFNGPTYIPEKGLRPEFGTRPVDPAPVYTLNHIGGIESLDKESVSATSIDFDPIKNMAYVSWHKRGDSYDGYIDVVNIADKSISTLHSATQDFNSISVVGSEISAAGGDAKGAIISNINYTNSIVSADFLHIEGASANSVLCVDTTKWVTSNSGITILPENKFIPVENAKYAALSGDKVVVLAGTPSASLYVFEKNGELVKSFSCGTISIENGKNTIFADGGTVYVSLGVAGLRSYDLQGNMLNEFTGFVSVDDGAVNGVSVDEHFVYMACGLSGLHILDKRDFSPVKQYTLNGASANFVKKASDGLLYVAYGLNGVHIFELIVE